MFKQLGQSGLRWFAKRLAPYIPAGPLAENLPELPPLGTGDTGSMSHAAKSNGKATRPKAIGSIEDPALYDVLNEIYERVHRLHVLVNEVFDGGLLLRLNRAEHNIQVMQNAVNGMEQTLAVLQHQQQQAQWGVRREILRQRRALANPRPHSPAPAIKSGSKSFAESLAALEPLAPQAYAIWKPLLDVNADAYAGFPTHSCSVAGHDMAELFGCFLAPLLHGTVLDIGCGPQPVPSYLANYPVESIAGLDPLAAPHPFVFHHGVAEFLPWDDASFDLVIAATSLDHVLLLDRSVDEFRRVLRPGGRFVTWVSFVAGAPEYNPYRADVGQEDEFHLFHFDRPWFESTMQRHFKIDESFVFDSPYDQAFYSLSLK
ncbi:MAG: class I SAM-dependent methyltransferase [Planctomycetaceae bacterium]|nr:class I SAM-dependent methyltransferase [Planctomycetaceae bacterium]